MNMQKLKFIKKYPKIKLTKLDNKFKNKLMNIVNNKKKRNNNRSKNKKI